jgi:hypothetical protein
MMEKPKQKITEDTVVQMDIGFGTEVSVMYKCAPLSIQYQMEQEFELTSTPTKPELKLLGLHSD